MDCTFLDIYGRLPAAALTPATSYAAYLVYGTAQGHRGLRFPDQETAVSLGGRATSGAARPCRRAVFLRPDEAEARKFWGAGVVAPDDGGGEEPRLRGDGWWEVEMGRLRASEAGDHGAPGEEVVASFEVLGSYPKRGLIVEGIEFRPLQ
ncbi:F-box protein PP2-B11-like [Panicum miliaceum]|uniref:F-box protein PP2-B11-like n=1 Tax=Panicum miliaceum TaxID=4540 RepID=A0A3L6TTM7_PANMI|nr:F-box protein PP2-B11-like [Panicum miliaceum]